MGIFGLRFSSPTQPPGLSRGSRLTRRRADLLKIAGCIAGAFAYAAICVAWVRFQVGRIAGATTEPAAALRPVRNRSQRSNCSKSIALGWHVCGSHMRRSASIRFLP